MYDEAHAVMEQGRLAASVTQTRIAFMRYVGQGHEIPVFLPIRTLSAADVPPIHAAYEQEYAKFFDRAVPGSDVEVMSFAVVLTTGISPVEIIPPVTEFTEPQSPRSQLVRDTSSGATALWAVYDRTAMTPGTRVSGPAIISEDETSTLVGPEWQAFVNNVGYLEMIRETD
jgi:N-methylhydantoinase A